MFDTGNYLDVVNLTSGGKITKIGDTCSFATNESGKFMYQGNLDTSTKLPWNISVSYAIDGHELSANELAGKSGVLTMKIKIEPTNDNATKSYLDNFLIQATAKFDNSNCTNIVANGATSAQSSGQTQLSYMVFPSKTGSLK